MCYILDDDSGFVRTAEKGDFIDKLSKSGRSDLITWFKSLTSEQQETAYSVLLVMEELSLLRPNWTTIRFTPLRSVSLDDDSANLRGQHLQEK